MTVGGIKPFQWRPPSKLYDDVKRSADKAGVSMNYEVTRLVRWALDEQRRAAK